MKDFEISNKTTLLIRIKNYCIGELYDFKFPKY